MASPLASHPATSRQSTATSVIPDAPPDGQRAGSKDERGVVLDGRSDMRILKRLISGTGRRQAVWIRAVALRWQLLLDNDHLMRVLLLSCSKTPEVDST